MADVFDYIKWRGDLSFYQSRFCAVDGLVLSELTFINFDALGGGEDVCIKSAADGYCPSGSYDDTDFGLIVPTVKINKLFCKCGDTKRFGNIMVSDFIEKTDAEEGIQFAAMTFHISRDRMVVAFRGTDDSLIGWREDCCLSYLDEIPAQGMAVRYLSRVANKYPGKKIVVVGHSKGGNLSMYSALKCPEEVAERIIRAYSFDGPGLSKKMMSGERYHAMKSRLEIILPQSAYVGVMFERGERFSVIKSTGRGLFQHDPFTWEIEGAALVPMDELSTVGKLHEARFRARMEELNAEDRRAVVEMIFDSISASGIKTLSELRERGFAKVLSVIKTYGSYDKQKRELVRTLLFKR